MVAIPIVTQTIPDLEVIVNSEESRFNLFDYFDDPFTTGLVARFELSDPTNIFPNEGVTEVLLFDQIDEGAPLTVENFINYVEDGDYINSIIHRSISDFVIQGGGFTVDGLADALAENDAPSAVSSVSKNDPVANEFSANRSNVIGTIAMAKLGGDPNSATSEWFFNLGNNAANLDNQNGGFTVFGEVRFQEDFDVPLAVSALPTFDASSVFNQSAFTDLPLKIDSEDSVITEEILTGDEDFVRYENISISQQEELEFVISNNSNPNLVEASIEQGELTLNYLEDETGEAEITIQGINLLGQTVEDTFLVSVTETLSPQPEPELLFGSLLENDSIETTDTTPQSFIFTGTGEDLVNNANTSEDSNRLYGGKDNDELILGRNDRAFGGDGDDILSSSFGTGNNRLYGGAGNDTLAVGTNDRAFGGDGDDLLGFTTGGGNILFGGAGNDTFIITPGGAPNQINTIADFTDGEDVISLSGFPDNLDQSKFRITATPDGQSTLIGIEDALVLLEGVPVDVFS